MKLGPPHTSPPASDETQALMFPSMRYLKKKVRNMITDRLGLSDHPQFNSRYYSTFFFFINSGISGLLINVFVCTGPI